MRDGNEQKVDLLVPSTQTECECGPEANYPAGNDVFTALLLALPPQTWSGIKDQTLMHEMKQLISMASLPTLLQEEVNFLPILFLGIIKSHGSLFSGKWLRSSYLRYI